MNFKFLNGSNGDQSSKRLVLFIVTTLWVIYFFANLFWGKILKQTLEDNLLYMVVTFFIGVAAEKVVNNVAKKMEAPKDEEPVK